MPEVLACPCPRWCDVGVAGGKHQLDEHVSAETWVDGGLNIQLRRPVSGYGRDPEVVVMYDGTKELGVSPSQARSLARHLQHWADVAESVIVED